MEFGDFGESEKSGETWESKIGTITSGFEHFGEWKRVEDENEIGDTLLDTMIQGTCEQSRFIDILENFTLFSASEGHPVKIVAKNHQYLGVNNAIESFKKRKENEGQIGVFWHTQGSGKSYSMIFFLRKKSCGSFRATTPLLL
jgi:type I restriction enzyme R subunit